MQIEELPEEGGETGKLQFVTGEVWLLFLGVHLWNVPGVGHSGSMLNLPVIDYYEHAAFFTGGHPYGALFDVNKKHCVGQLPSVRAAYSGARDLVSKFRQDGFLEYESRHCSDAGP